MADHSKKQCVVVTGFGPFEGHQVNASWECVKELEKIGLGGKINIIICEIPVAYKKAKSIIPALWEKHNPLLMVHVGVSGQASEITLETLAHNDGYLRPDVESSMPEDCMCISDSCHEVIQSEIDMNQVCQKVNQTRDLKVKSVVSDDPGRYLCDFTYFLSLHQDKSRSAFIHVPPLQKPYTVIDLALGLQASIQAMLCQVNGVK